jgi:cell division protein FtsB
MDFGDLIPIAGIVSGTVIFVSALRYVRDRQTQRATPPEAARENEKLARENEGLRGTVGKLEERIAVLERIATDPAERTAREIEQLR